MDHGKKEKNKKQKRTRPKCDGIQSAHKIVQSVHLEWTHVHCKSEKVNVIFTFYLLTIGRSSPFAFMLLILALMLSSMACRHLTA